MNVADFHRCKKVNLGIFKFSIDLEHAPVIDGLGTVDGGRSDGGGVGSRLVVGGSTTNVAALWAVVGHCLEAADRVLAVSVMLA